MLAVQSLASQQIVLRLQDKNSTFSGPMDVLKTIVKKDGLLGLYVGMESTFWRYAPLA